MMATKIEVDQFMSRMTCKVKPIDTLHIPGITVPPHLTDKFFISNDRTLRTEIRMLLNRLTLQNLQDVSRELHNIVKELAISEDSLKDIADEFMKCIIMCNTDGENNYRIKEYLTVFSSIQNSALIVNVNGTRKSTLRIRDYFISCCKSKYSEISSLDYIKNLASKDIDDPQDADELATGREFFTNILLLLSFLYENRLTDNVNLGSSIMISILGGLVNNYMKSCTNAEEAYHILEIMDTDEAEHTYDIHKQMCSLYAEEIFVILENEIKIMKNDKFLNQQGVSLSNIIDKVFEEVLPTITESYLISKYDDLGQ
jgi:transcriptional regulator with PAS, ATPase and Fis domain